MYYFTTYKHLLFIQNGLIKYICSQFIFCFINILAFNYTFFQVDSYNRLNSALPFTS